MRALYVRAAARGRGWHVAIANNRHNEQGSNLEDISAGFEPGTSRMRSVFLPSELCKKTPPMGAGLAISFAIREKASSSTLAADIRGGFKPRAFLKAT